MSLIEILTAINLFCPHVSAGTSYERTEWSNVECVANAWKCVDKVRKPIAPKDSKCWTFSPRHKDQEFDHWIQYPGCKDVQDFEKCFR